MELGRKHCLDFCISITGFGNYDEETINLVFIDRKWGFLTPAPSEICFLQTNRYFCKPTDI